MDESYLVVNLNARLQPMHRGEFFEDPLEKMLDATSLGSLAGGGTLVSAQGEVERCDIEIVCPWVSEAVIAQIVTELERLGAPKGSRLVVEAEDRSVPCGRDEGLALYLNGTDLPDAVYAECDSNFVYSELDRLLTGQGRVLSYWQGPTETAFYLYGASFRAMREAIAAFIAEYPLCQRSRIEQIA